MPNLKALFSIIAGLVIITTPVASQDVWITGDTPFIELLVGDDFIVIERNQDNDAIISPAFARTSRPCPPFCIQPMSTGEGVDTYGEMEVLNFLEGEVQSGEGLLIDARTPSFYHAGTIPGSTNLPFNLLSNSETNPFVQPILTQFGAVKNADGSWNFDNAKSLALFCNGPWCGQSPRAIGNLLSLGYPPEKLKYYRGGMQNWLMLGLTVVVPSS